MSTALLVDSVSKHKPEPESERSSRKTTTKIDPELLRKAKAVAAIRGIDLFDLIDEVLRGPVEREYARRVRED